jgi:hypothetical protein
MVNRLSIPEPCSAGIFLSYRCTSTCKHCLYACSPRWPDHWISEDDAIQVLAQLAAMMRRRDPHPGCVGVNDGLHLTGGEPFLNFGLLLRLVGAARQAGIPTIFVETNGFWCRDDAATRDRLRALQAAGMDGILISANPFILEQIPFERTERAVRVSRQVFGANAIVYQAFFYEQFRSMGLTGTLDFEDYVQRAGHGLHYVELFPNGRVPYRLAHLFRRSPARRFFGSSCRHELIRDWHMHVDSHCNYLPGFCGGLSLGDARQLDVLCQDGVDLDALPVLRALLSDLEDLHRLGREFGYQERDGYISKCHLCLDIRRHLVQHGDFAELQPSELYEHLGEGL